MNENLWVAAVVGAFLYYHFKSRLKHTIRLTTVKTLLTTYSRYSWFPLILWVTIRFEYKKEPLDQSMDFFKYGRNCCQIFFGDPPTWGGNLGPNLHPRGRFLGPWFFIILKNSHQDLSNEGSNFILSSPEVGHWVAQT